MKYVPFMELHLAHEFYADRRCHDFEIEPSLATKQLLRNHRCVLKSIPAGVRGYICVSEERKPLIPFVKDAILSFHLWLRNPDFALFTDLTDMNLHAAPLFTNVGTNAATSTQLFPRSRSAGASDQFVVQRPGEAEQFLLHNRPEQGLAAAHFSVSGLGTVLNPTSYDEGARNITIDSRDAQVGDSFTVSYPIPARLEKGVWADVDIQIGDDLSSLANEPANFQILFPSKSARWTYYVIVDKAEHQLHIKDKDVAPHLFSDEHRTNLNQHPDTSDDIAARLASRFPQKWRIRFVSDEPIPCRQQVRKSIQLYSDDKQVVKTLPTPSPRNFTTINMAKNSVTVTENAFFQVIEYFTHQI